MVCTHTCLLKGLATMATYVNDTAMFPHYIMTE